VVWAEKGKDTYLNDLNRIEQSRKPHCYLDGYISQNAHDVDGLMDLEDISDISDINSAKNYLSQRIFSLVNVNYDDKSTYVSTVESAFRQLIDYYKVQPLNQKFSATEIINQLCDLYDYINLPENKDKINIHKNPNLDNKLGIINTSSWQKMVGVIREMSLTILFEEAEKLQPASRADYLQDYCYRYLFKEHRSNRFFRKKESITKSVEKINQKMAEYRSALPGETLKNSGR
jgi:hypothetical protein